MNTGLLDSVEIHVNCYGCVCSTRGVSLPALTAKDNLDVKLGLELGVDFIALSHLFDPQNTIETALKTLMKNGQLRPGSTVVIIGLIMVGEQIVDAVQMRVM